ncbi:MAG TPA: hypothetical protein VJT72_15400 [Pseudonocardiaceae bacterium]|nr:hypothetical protein [Pseudonocardiaceae bacterium]
MKNNDHVLWERELAEHMSRHPDLQHLPPPVFTRPSRGISLLPIKTLMFVLIAVSALVGWLIGLHLI